jgi:hypothetical protein
MRGVDGCRNTAGMERGKRIGLYLGCTQKTAEHTSVARRFDPPFARIEAGT